MKVLREYDPELSSVVFAGVFFFAGLTMFNTYTNSELFRMSLVFGVTTILLFCLSYIYALRGVQEALFWSDPKRREVVSANREWVTVHLERPLVNYLQYRGLTEYDGATSLNETVSRMAKEDDDIEIRELQDGDIEMKSD